MKNNKSILMIQSEEYNGKDEWKSDFCLHDDSLLFIDKASNNILAEVIIVDDFSYIQIDSFEVKRTLRNKGVARECIKILMDYSLSLGKKGLTGGATQDATAFWSRIGADITFSDECDYCNGDCDSCEYYDEDELNDFILKPMSFYSYYETRKTN